jgi:pimeloyl-ACP methyl ester carboxylesterase
MRTPTIGDRDVVRPEHAVEMYRLIPNAQLAILPGGDHFMLWSSPDKVLATLTPFLEAPISKAKS